MNYAKVVGAALQLFPKKIKATVINEVTGSQIGVYKIPMGQLPAAFNKPLTLEVEGHAWRVVKAEPVKAEDFYYSKKLTLHVLEKTQLPDERLLFNVPTRHAYHPLMTQSPVLQGYILDIDEENWRQLEFLPADTLSLVQKEMSGIEPILTAHSLWGYNSMHVREQTANLDLHISLADFCNEIKAFRTGTVRVCGNAFVQNGFAVETAYNTYYGIAIENTIKSLCLPAFDCMDEEFLKIMTTYNLLLADWCQARVIMGDVTDVDEPANVDYLI